jgi:hypothetical protein
MRLVLYMMMAMNGMNGRKLAVFGGTEMPTRINHGNSGNELILVVETNYV